MTFSSRWADSRQSIWLGLVGFWWFEAENDFCSFPLPGLVVAVGGGVGVGVVCVPC